MTQDLQKPFGTTLGRIESPYNNRDRHCRIKFSCVKNDHCSYISVHHISGILKLGQKSILNLPLRNGIRSLTLSIEISQSCSHSRKFNNTFVTINLFIFPNNYGDNFLKTNMIEKQQTDIKENNFNSREMTINLHTIMRTINKENNPHALKEMMASVKVDTLLENTTNTIVKRYVTTRPGNNFRFHPN